MINKDTIDKIFDAAVIEEVVGEFVQLKKSGSSYKGFSPFTNEKTPSFYVVPHKGIYKCFSSGKGGNAVNFLMEHEKLSYPEALRWVADKYGIEVEEEQQSPEELQERSDRENLSVVNEYAQKYFTQQMMETDEGKSVGLGYLRERGFNDNIIDTFLLGYCPDQWDAFTKEALKNEYQLKYLEKSGLTKLRDGAPYDFFRGRIMFPIRNVSGKVIAFGGRTLKSGKKIAKYFNSPESELYIKSNTLYGLYLAKAEISKNDNCYIVEGYTDVISLHQAEVKNVVASAGTSLTTNQIRKIKRYTKNITILFDGDAAGIRASFRGIDMILKEGMNVRVVLFPDGEDPDSFAMNKPTDEVHTFLENNAKDFIVFKSDLLKKEAQNDPIKRSAMVREIVESIGLIPDPIQREIYTRECSMLLEVDERTLLTEVNKILRKNIAKSHGEEPPPDLHDNHVAPKQGVIEPLVSLDHQERDLVRLLLIYGDRLITFQHTENNEEGKEIKEKIETTVSQFLIDELDQDEIQLKDPILNRIVSEYRDHLDDDKFPPETFFTQHSSQEISKVCTDILMSPYELSDNWTIKHKIYPEKEEKNLKQAVESCTYRYKLQIVKSMLDEISDQIKSSDENNLESLLQRKIVLDRAKREISEFFGTVITH